jgi:hypothetical protein
MELYCHSPNTPSWCGAHLKHRDFIFTYMGLEIALGTTCTGNWMMRMKSILSPVRNKT